MRKPFIRNITLLMIGPVSFVISALFLVVFCGGSVAVWLMITLCLCRQIVASKRNH